ncbi:hypothetical protein V6N11_056162 [Hibiscus sabdariffa]|uniref:Secreted protein n=1 Tax=Hibiscus sabdariffa TaxID=183260 RepID=A0ABR2T309_9ROSI
MAGVVCISWCGSWLIGVGCDGWVRATFGADLGCHFKGAMELRSTPAPLREWMSPWGCTGRHSVLASASLSWPVCGMSIACHFESSISVLCYIELRCCLLHLAALTRFVCPLVAPYLAHKSPPLGRFL